MYNKGKKKIAVARSEGITTDIEEAEANIMFTVADKVIYKYIYQTKASQREEMYYKYILPKKSIEDVREDVEKWAEQQNAVIDDLKNNERYRKEFLQNLSHEIKTPIFAIQGYVDTLLNGALEKPEVNKKFLQNASKNIDRLVDLVEDDL